MYLIIISVIFVCMGFLGFLYGFVQKARASALEAKARAETRIAADFQQIANDKDEYIKSLTNERDQLEMKLRKIEGGQDKARRNLVTELENITRYDGTDKGQKSYEQ